jgi:chromosome segregation ATPase
MSEIPTLESRIEHESDLLQKQLSSLEHLLSQPKSLQQDIYKALDELQAEENALKTQWLDIQRLLEDGS